MTERNPADSPSPDEPIPEELRRKLSRVVLKAAERGRQGLFELLTAENAEKIAKLLKKKPLLYENLETAPRQLLLDPDITNLLPDSFYENPTQWIESQPSIERGHREVDLPQGEKIDEFWEYPYDISIVKQFRLETKTGPLSVVSKRIRRDGLDEVARSKLAYEAGIPTPRILGEIIDRGNIYAFFEHIPGINLRAAVEKLGLALGVYPPATTWDKKALRADIENAWPGPISDSDYNRLRRIWQNYKKVILEYEICVTIKGLCLRFIEHACFGEDPGIDKRDDDLLKKRLRDYPQRSVTKILNEAGYVSFENLKETINENTEDPERGTLLFDKLFSEIVNRFQNIMARLKPAIDEFRELFEAEVRVIKMGFDYVAETNRIIGACDEHGIRHKDFAYRNFVIPWDFENDRPLPPQTGRPPLYLVDWETEKSPKAVNEENQH